MNEGQSSLGRRTLLASIAAAAAAGAGYMGWRYVAGRESLVCLACSRPIHSHSRVTALVDGERRSYCCLACAQSERQQTGEHVEVVELTDYEGGQRLKPMAAVIVRGGDVNPCLAHHAAVTADKQPLHAHFDRCSPSMLAFADADKARDFAREHGGQVVPFRELAAGFDR